MNPTERVARGMVWAMLCFAGVNCGNVASPQDYPPQEVGAKVMVTELEEGRQYRVDVEIQNLGREDLVTIAEGRVEYQVFPRILRAASLQEVGRPELPFVKVNVPLRFSGESEVTVGAIETLAEWDRLRIAPARRPWPDSLDPPGPARCENQEVYRTNDFFPYYPAARLGAVRRLRGITYQTCHFYPAEYNPVTGTVRLSRIAATLSVKPPRPEAEMRPMLERMETSRLLDYSPTFAQSYLALSAEYRPPRGVEVDGAKARHWRAAPDAATGCEYLIIAPDDFAEAIAPLVAAKRERESMGLLVRSLTFSEMEIGDDAGAEERRAKIRRAIRKQCSLVPRPRYVLLVGNAERIPPFHRTVHPDPREGYIATDLFYATTDGGDLLPDVALGRLPARNAQDVTVMVDKILRYEDGLASGGSPSWGNALVAAEYENAYSSPQTTTGRWFLQTAHSVERFLANEDECPEVGDVHRVYTAYRPSAPTPWYFYDQQEVPADLVNVMGQYAGNASAATAFIKTNWVAGVRLALHRDHGDRWGWVNPRFSTSDVDDLQAPAVPPVVLSINCRSGWYDGPQVCFAEKLMHHPHGACAVVAASRISWSNANDRFAEGLIKGIWSRFEFDFLLPDSRRLVLGDVFNSAKVHLANNYAGDVLDESLQLFNLFGDPEMTVRGIAPLAVEAPREWGPEVLEFPPAMGTGKD